MAQKRYKTEHQQAHKSIQEKKIQLLQKIISIASQEKLLPKFVYELDIKCGNGRKNRFLQYQKVVKNLYGQQSRIPLKYDPNEAMTDQQKLHKKIIQLQNNELQIDYFQRIRSKDGKIIPHFKGNQIQKVSYPTKKQFQMFNDFNQKKFLKSYSHIFDDQLQLKQASLFRKQRIKTIAVIPETTKEEYSGKLFTNPKFNKFQFQDLKQKQKGLTKIKNVKLRSLTDSIQTMTQNNVPSLKPINQKYRPHIEKTTIGKLVQDMKNSLLYDKMLKIGSYPSSVSTNLISLTRQSLAKYLKSSYDRQVRIMDFLQVKPAFSLEQYTALCTKLKLMQVEHIIFMTFLFYDFNNDGYICQYDIRRIRNLVQGKQNKIIEQDLKLIQSIKQKKQFDAKVLFQQSQINQNQQQGNLKQKQGNYLQLYKLPQITQLTYFHWLKKCKQKKYEVKEEIKQQKLLQDMGEIEIEQQKQKKVKNAFNPSVLKYKYNYFEQKSQVRKYIMGIKANKLYITFNEFKSKYINRDENRLVNHSLDSRAMHSSKPVKQMMKNESILISSRNEHSRSQVKLENVKKQIKYKYQQTIYKPYLWYDLMDKLAGIRYQGLKYQ